MIYNEECPSLTGGALVSLGLQGVQMGFLDPARVPSAFTQIDLRAGVVIGVLWHPD